MTTGTPGEGGNDILDGELRFEDLVKRDALDELCRSFFALFGIPVRVYSREGTLLADVAPQQEVCKYVNTTSRGRTACGATVTAARSTDPGAGGDALHPCFTGAVYRIIAIEYEGRRMGRMILGPFVPTNVGAPPEELLAVDPAFDAAHARSLLAKMPRAKPETITRIADHLKAALDLILFSGHKTLVTSQMHVASVRESYRELEEKNRKLQEAYDRLKELDRLKSNFLATVSHELRTPLTSIIGYSEMLKEGIAGPLVGEQVEFVRTIHEKGEQLLALIMSLLDLSKLESGTMSVRKGPVQISGVLAQVVSTLTPTAQRKGVALRMELDDGLPELRGDAERLRQVFLNLTENAIKFTPQGGRVTLRARPSPGDAKPDGEDAGYALLAPAQAQIEVRVIDTGIGIPMRERSRVFDPFYQVDSSSTRAYGGTGLGLSIVKRLLDAHAGAVRIEDNEPQGSVFVVSIPLTPPARTSVIPPPVVHEGEISRRA